MGDTTARALRLLSLLQARRWWTGAELRERLGVSERSLRRDVDRLRSLGYPIEATPGPAGGYRLGAGAEMPPLLLDEEEAVAMAVGLGTAALGAVAGIEEASVRALAKLEQVLPPRMWRDVELFRSLPVTATGNPARAEVGPLLTVARACRDGERIRFGYRSRRGEESERHVEPHHLVMIHHRWYLLAFDRERDDWRTFRVDRMGETWATGMRFQEREVPGGDAESFVSAGLGEGEYRYEAQVICHILPEELPHWIRNGNGAVEPVEDGSLLHFRDDSLDWLAMRILWLGVDFRVLDPPELVETVAALGERLRRASGG
ncbi:MAG TPA: YafY family protein [Acidimicrobiia bacterium]|nr:YafY family protein [Acidimicrobiia bacterium]